MFQVTNQQNTKRDAQKICRGHVFWVKTENLLHP